MFLNFVFSTSHELFLRAKIYQITVVAHNSIFFFFIRSVSGDDHMISAAVRSLREAGFINYFGMQRFGTSSIPTHHIGR